MKSIAIVFPGQGSQTVGMLVDIAKEYPEVEKTFSVASQILGYDLWKLVQHGPAEELDKTIHTQPALLTSSYALWQIIQKQSNESIKPSFLAGHSLGEYTALACANALSFQDAVRLVAARGQYMQEAVPVGQGALAAVIGLDDDVVKEICKNVITSTNEVLEPANFNSTGQVVISGHKTAVERAVILSKEKGAKLAMLLPVSVPSHCSLMKPAAERLSKILSSITIQNPTLPILNNVDVIVYENPEQIRDGLVRQLFMPVRWVDIIKKLSEQGITQMIECGPGKVLSGLIKRTNREINTMAIGDLSGLQGLLNLSLERE